MQGKFKGIEWLELEGGIMTECAIMKKSLDGHVWFFPIASLDMIDKQRLLNIVRNRNAELYELWDLMSQITLGNGVNALTYFNQLVKVRTPAGQILPFNSGRYGTPAAPTAQYNEVPVMPDSMVNAAQLQKAVSAAKSARPNTRAR